MPRACADRAEATPGRGAASALVGVSDDDRLPVGLRADNRLPVGLWADNCLPVGLWADNCLPVGACADAPLTARRLPCGAAAGTDD